MSDKLFLENQFRKRKIPEGSGDYGDYEKCRHIIQCQGKLNVQIYNEHLKIAADYVGHKEVDI